MTAASVEEKPIEPPADTAPHLLVVDDDRRIRDLLARYLRENGFRVTVSADAGEARNALRGLAFDLIILDIMMPGESGLSLAETLRAESDVPILMLTARSEPESRVEGLELGVDDYMAKPFDPRELLLRLQNILRRRTPQDETPDEIRFGDCVFNVLRGDLTRGGELVKLTDRERELLRQFARAPGETIARHELLGDDAHGTDRAIDVQINRLRRKIEVDPANPVHLQTVRGRGYVLYVD
ncbi:response regulator [Dichotomicrobium thermohalophilum]|uniref:Two-component system phosphate regulon response regulator OmpR n=1 Tax=Dichotomicrobium thermohalophilum TaxID=933063 RepID=A0A397Q572_9HYPH|nr:response regulator transcription factor [Dichotomicrobium thermohalophilum]RIA56198.1 two-component system phosphate regulon response regulator OmpR [Dichotomicrobium thermohalophilum]